MSTNAPLTPIEDPEPTAPAIDYSPATITYDEHFENHLMKAILYPNDTPPVQHSLSSPPHIDPTTLPIPLNSALRTHASIIPGVYLTHENGYHTGGPGPSPATVNEFASRFIAEHGITDAGELERLVEEEIKKRLDIVMERMREREEAVMKNEGISRKVSELEVQRRAEERVLERVREERGRRRG
ncbi:hypothetical protein BDV96DRAFT_613135 [Lophiotrema nucula]|uniref:Uncharacterized protein n=1 Tax=Lophiotrema nucula TaxID=690887 RepID=A0A6A5Z5X4_9PLEO|nr:hypothetical protein BDV96DRAFT_613135 [Lophiotrema nucula]